MKRIFAVLLVTFITLLVFAGCGNSTSPIVESDSDYSYDGIDSSYNNDYDYDSDYDYDGGYSYDKNDKYYSSNDHNYDGKISDSEFQDAMGDYLDDLMGY